MFAIDDPYEKPVRDAELNEVHVYQKGQRITTDDHAVLLQDLSFDNIGNIFISPKIFSTLKFETNLIEPQINTRKYFMFQKNNNNNNNKYII